MQRDHGCPIRGRDVALQSTEIVGQDGIVGGEGNRSLESRGIHHLLLPAELADTVNDVHPDLEVAHLALLALRRSQIDPSGGMVTSALAGKCPHGSSCAVTTPRLPNCPEPS